MQKNILLFDVESTSLHGTGFAVGAIVVNRGGTEIDRFELLSKEGAEKANEWVKQNVIPNLSDIFIRSGRRAMVPSSFIISTSTPPGVRSASKVRSIAASVCPARRRTPLDFDLRGKM